MIRKIFIALFLLIATVGLGQIEKELPVKPNPPKLVVDFTGLNYMLDNFDVPIVFDVTHSVQKPGGNGTSSGGNRTYVPGLARAASALGISNFFLEVHSNPDEAPSDGPNMVKLTDFEDVVKNITKYHFK
jgi:2-dehydro-3-deoxyphosphooctonate aldolase (KDO 8-P synthase)